MTQRYPIGLVFCALALFPACGEEVEPIGGGTLALEWEVSPRGCESAGVEQVQVRLRRIEDVRETTFPCEEREAMIADVPGGGWELTLVGLDEFERETHATTAEMITIRPERLNEVPLRRLTARAAQIEVVWRFENGRVCGANGAEEIEVAVFDASDYEVERARFTCDDGLGVVDGLPPGEYLIQGVARGAEASPAEGFASVTVERGDREQVEIVLALP